MGPRITGARTGSVSFALAVVVAGFLSAFLLMHVGIAPKALDSPMSHGTSAELNLPCGMPVDHDGSAAACVLGVPAAPPAPDAPTVTRIESSAESIVATVPVLPARRSMRAPPDLDCLGIDRT